MMKKILLVAFMVICMVVPVMAANIDDNSQAILDKLKNLAVEVDGETVTVPEQYIAQIEAYVSKDDFTMDDDTYNALVAIIDKTAAAATENGVKHFSDLPDAVRTDILADIEAVAEPLEVTVTYDVSKGFLVVDKNGEQVFVSTLAGTTDTGLSVEHLSIALMAIVVALAGCTWFVAKKGAKTLA